MIDTADNVVRPTFGKREVAAESAANPVSSVVLTFPTKQAAVPTPAVEQASPASLKANLTLQEQAQWAMWWSHNTVLPNVCMTSLPRTAKGSAPKKPTPPTIPPGRPSALRLVANNDELMAVAA